MSNPSDSQLGQPPRGLTSVTFKVLHGADRGRLYADLQPPLTVGREEGNDIQLNDERVSRCHFKVQRDNDRLVLTDLDSTNGTKVNGSECQLKILRHGDLIAVGRSLMLVGSESQIAARMAAMGDDSSVAIGGQPAASREPEADFPSLPSDLTPGQKAQVGELIEHLQDRLHRLIDSARMEENGQRILLDFEAWQRMVATKSQLAVLSRHIADPTGSD